MGPACVLGRMVLPSVRFLKGSFSRCSWQDLWSLSQGWTAGLCFMNLSFSARVAGFRRSVGSPEQFRAVSVGRAGQGFPGVSRAERAARASAPAPGRPAAARESAVPRAGATHCAPCTVCTMCCAPCAIHYVLCTVCRAPCAIHCVPCTTCCAPQPGVVPGVTLSSPFPAPMAPLHPNPALGPTAPLCSSPVPAPPAVHPQGGAAGTGRSLGWSKTVPSPRQCV